MLTKEAALEKLIYLPETGVFINRVRRGSRKAGAVAGTKQPSGYIAIHICGGQIRAHRLAWLCAYGYLPPCGIDHINHDRSDNRIENLRLADAAINAKNARKRRLNKSGITGVYFNKVSQKWRAQIMDGYKCIYIGEFDQISGAAAARKAEEERRGYHENHGR